MIRTFWLALACLIGLGIMAAVKITTRNVPESYAISKQQETIPSITQGIAAIAVTRAQAEPPEAKSDRLAVLKSDTSPTVMPPIAAVPKNPESLSAEPNVKIVSRHWRDPLAPILDPKRPKVKNGRTDLISKPIRREIK